jgi:hypothetical protein
VRCGPLLGRSELIIDAAYWIMIVLVGSAIVVGIGVPSRSSHVSLSER